MSDYEDDVEPTPEEKKAIIRHLVSKAPAGEGPSLCKDLKEICGEELLDSDTASEFLQARAEERCDFVVKTGLVICKEAAVDGGYLNPSTGEVCTVNFTNLSITNTTSGDKPDSAFRDQVEKAVNKYVSAHFLQGQGECQVATAVFEDGSVTTVIITAKNVNLGNFWTGSWVTRLTANADTKKINVNTECNVHYFEHGNVQLNTNRKGHDDLKMKGEGEAAANSIVDALKAEENEFQAALSQFYAKNKKIFKKVRRALTIQGTKMDWRVAIVENVASMKNN